jgi:hypothetical protein
MPPGWAMLSSRGAMLTGIAEMIRERTVEACKRVIAAGVKFRKRRANIYAESPDLSS